MLTVCPTPPGGGRQQRNPVMTTRMNADMNADLSSGDLSGLDLDALAWAIDADGLAAHEGAAHRVAQLAADAAVAPTLVEVLRDTHMPAPVRERAFGLVALALARVAAGSDQDMVFAN